jgi:ArsR family transcriptional regulator, arsenate/arsenite/antimonite-responsive transcriptional repressor
MNTSTVVDRLPMRRRSEPCCATLALPSLDAERTAALAEMLDAIGDPTRLGMLDLLVQQPEPICVCDITSQFPQNQPTISHHLKLLRHAGLVGTEKRGIWSYYWATDAGRRVFAALSGLR